MRAGPRVLAAIVAVAPTAVRAEDDWRFESQSAVDAVHAQANQIYPTPLTQARLTYQDMDDGGSAATVMFEVSVPMPFVLVPGLNISNIFSFLRVEVPIVSLDVPMTPRVTGISDMHVIDAAIKYWEGVAVGFGLAMLVPSASNELLGRGQLAIGPIAGASVDLGEQTASIRGEYLTTIAGADFQPDIDVLIVRPSFIQYLPYAAYVSVEPNIRFNWGTGGESSVQLLARAGHAVNKRWVFVIEPGWTAVGSGRNDLSLSLITSYLGW